MSYRALYDSIQPLPVHIRRKLIRTKVQEIAEAPGIQVLASALDTRSVRGFYVSPRNVNHPLVKQFGRHVIVVARGLNRCWTRFIMVKELMHLLDEVEEATDTGDEFETMLSELNVPSKEKSPQTLAELKAFWMALGVLCPENIRLELQREREEGRIDDYSIALRLRIPEAYVHNLFTPRYSVNIQAIIGG